MIYHLALVIDDEIFDPPDSLPSLETTPNLINNALTLFITAGIILTIIYIIWGGIKWITSGGDKKKVAAARAQLTWSIIGLIIILTSFFTISILSYAFGIKLLNIDF